MKIQSPSGDEDDIFASFTTPKHYSVDYSVGIPSRENGRPKNLLENAIEVEMFSRLKVLVL